MTEVLVPEMGRKTYGGHHFPKRKWNGKKKGERLTYKWKKRPYVHQVQAVKKLLSTGFGGALLMEPRTGKTKVAVDYTSIMHAAGKVNRVVVFTPVSGLGVWEDELKANCPFPYRLTTWDKKTRKRTNLELPRMGDDVLDFLVINYDALSVAGAIIPWKMVGCEECSQVKELHTKAKHAFKPGMVRSFDKNPLTGEIKRSKSRGGRFELKKKLKLWQPQLIILDESHRIKSPSARKSTLIHSIADIPEYRMILTGTVVTKRKRAYDVYSQWKFLNPDRFGEMTFSEFKSIYSRMINKNGYEQWIRNRNEEQLHRLIHLDAFSITREECYDLPKSTEQIIHVDLDESANVYDQMAQEMVAKIKSGEITEASIALVQGLRLRQITSGIAKTTPSDDYPEGRTVIIGSEKLRAIRARLEDLMEEDEKVVIGALFRPDILRLERMIKSLRVPVFIIKGGMKQADREYARKQFPKVSGGAVFIGQPAAAGEAIDLSCASILQWYSLTPSWVNYRQFTDRIALSAKPTFIEYFLARGTADELLYETLMNDQDFGKKMITSPERLLRGLQ